MSTNLIALQNRFLGQGETVYDHLHRLAKSRGGLSDADLLTLARDLNLPPAHVRSVAEFYDDLAIQPPAHHRLKVCMGEACRAAGAQERLTQLEQAMSAASVPPEQIALSHVYCAGHCGQGPNALLELGLAEKASSAGKSSADESSAEEPKENRALLLSLAAPGAAAELMKALVEHSDAPPALMRSLSQGGLIAGDNAIYPSEDPRAQLLLRHMPGDVTDLAKAREAGIYGALEAALQAPATDLIDAITLSALRGRGGAGFPAGLKLKTVAEAPSEDGKRYVVCNADEGDAGAYIDRELLERDPHTIIEGILLAAFAVGADEGYIYLRAEYPRAFPILEKALADARAAGLLGQSILGSSFGFDLHLVPGHGAYICGEETSLLRSLEGVAAQVSPKPPYPAIEGLRGKPTVVNNVETLANLPWISAHGGQAFADLGRGKSRGTKLVSLNSLVCRPGLYEVEMGTTLRELLFERAGGMAEGSLLKAFQIGGPLGGIFTEAHLDLPLTFEDLAAAGGMLGHGSIVVFDQNSCMVEVGRGLISFCAVESCGKCFPCRIGSVRGTEIFDKILAGEGAQSDLELLAELSETMRLGSLCALGGGIPLPIENLLTSFIGEFQKYIPDARTPHLLLNDP